MTPFPEVDNELHKGCHCGRNVKSEAMWFVMPAKAGIQEKTKLDYPVEPDNDTFFVILVQAQRDTGIQRLKFNEKFPLAEGDVGEKLFHARQYT